VKFIQNEMNKYLQRSTIVTMYFIFSTDCLSGEITSETMSYACILMNFNTQVIEDFISTAHRLAVKTPQLSGNYSLEDFMYPGIVLLVIITVVLLLLVVDIWTVWRKCSIVLSIQCILLIIC